MPGVLNGAAATRREPTTAEAVALAIAMAPPGEHITIHDEDCAVNGDDPDACTCAPMVVIAPVRGST